MHMAFVHINIKVVHVEHPVGQCQTEQRIKLNALGHRKQIVKIHVQIQHAYIVILEEIVERRLYTDRIGNIVLILDTQPDTFDFRSVTQAKPIRLFPFCAWALPNSTKSNPNKLILFSYVHFLLIYLS